MQVIDNIKYYSIHEVRLEFNKTTGMNKKRNSFINMFIARQNIKKIKSSDKKNDTVYISEEDKNKIIEWFWLYEQRRRINTKAREEAGKLTKQMNDLYI